MTQQPKPPPQIQIVRLVEVPAIDPNRLGKLDTLVEYLVHGVNPFTVRIQNENPTPTDVETAVRKHAATKIAVIGKTLTL